MSAGVRLRWIRLYYAATPVFVLVDWIFGVALRAPAFASEPMLRAGYYGLCLGCLAVSLWLPSLARLATLAESSLNLLLLVLSVFLPYYALAEAVLAETPASFPVDGVWLVGFCLSAAAWILMFQEGVGGLAPRPWRPTRRIHL